MRRSLTILSIAAMSVFMAQCTAKKTTTTTKSPEEVVAEVKKNFTDADMEEGKVIFQSSCKKCHPIKEPETRTVEKWERVLPRMSKKANLDNEQSNKVRAYVLAHASLNKS